jgi:hypothetical protein
MADQSALPFHVGDRVRILDSSGLKGRIVELRGPLGPKGVQIYGVRLLPRPYRAYIEVREDQLELIPAKNGVPKANVVGDSEPAKS